MAANKVSTPGDGKVALVYVESPYAGDVEANLEYLRRCMKDCIARGEAPFASHGLYTQPDVLDDTNLEERAKGIRCGEEWRTVADYTVVYTDRGISPGMEAGIARAKKLHKVKYRSIEKTIVTEVIPGNGTNAAIETSDDPG